MQRVLVSGATGHLGRELCKRLARLNFDVHGLTRRAPEGLADRAGRLHLHKIDGRTETLVDILDGLRPDTVLHLAGMAKRDHDSDAVTPLVEANVLHGIQLLESMRITGCKRIIMAGSSLQHASTEQYRALNLYAATKQAFESVLEYYADAFNFSAVRLTICNVYSEHHAHPTLMNDIATACRNGSSLVIQDPGVRIDLLHVEDAAEAFVRAMSLLEGDAAPSGQLTRYSVTAGIDFSPMELIELFEKLGNKRLHVVKPSVSRASRRTTPWRGQTVPGWEASIPIEEGISRILADTSHALAG